MKQSHYYLPSFEHATSYMTNGCLYHRAIPSINKYLTHSSKLSTYPVHQIQFKQANTNSTRHCKQQTDSTIFQGHSKDPRLLVNNNLLSPTLSRMVSGDPRPPSSYKGTICAAVNTSAERIFIATSIKLAPATNVASKIVGGTTVTRTGRGLKESLKLKKIKHFIVLGPSTWSRLLWHQRNF